jgi:hypothetical protein
MKKTLITSPLARRSPLVRSRARRRQTPDGVTMVSRSPPLSAAWRQEPCLALRSQHQGPTTMTLSRTNPSITGRIVTCGKSASGTDGVGEFAALRIATDAVR